MSSNATILTSTRWAGAREHMEKLRASGDIADLQVDYADFDKTLPEPQRGEEVVSKLTDEEMALFYEMYRLSTRMEDFQRAKLGDALSRAGDAIRSSDRNKSLMESLEQARPILEIEDEAKAHFSDSQAHAMLHATFYHGLGERLNLHDWRLGVRKGMRVVKVERRW